MARRRLNNIVYRVVVTLLGVLRRLPARITLSLGTALGLLAYLVAGRERRRAHDNLHRVWGHLPNRQRRKMVRRMFVNLGRSALECVVMMNPRHKTAWHSFEGDSRKTLEEQVARGRGVIYVTGHFGNWELMAAAVAGVADVYVLARSSYDSRFTQLIEQFRLGHGVRCIWVDRPGHLRQAVQALKKGAILGVLVDQPIRGAPMIPFLGRPAPTTTVVPGLARVTGAAVVGGWIDRLGPGRHQITVRTIELPMDSLNEAARCCSTIVEQAIASQPSQWVWSLDRWRFQGTS